MVEARVVALALAIGAVATVVCPPVADPVMCHEGGLILGGPFHAFVQCSGGAANVPPDPLIIRYEALALDLLLWTAAGLGAVTMLSATAGRGRESS